MPPVATRSHVSDAPPTLFVAFELGNAEWTLAMTTRMDQPPLVRTIPARGLPRLQTELARAKAHFGLAASAPVRSCYEAGRDGFWLHRYLESVAITNCVVDSSRIEVNRRRRRAKTDRLDAGKLVTMLLRAAGGEPKVWSVVKVPTRDAEDRRHVHRELLGARRDRVRRTNRIKGLLASHGVPLERIQELPTPASGTGRRCPRRWTRGFVANGRRSSTTRSGSGPCGRNAVSCSRRLRMPRLPRCINSRSSAGWGSIPRGSTSWNSSRGASSATGARSAASRA